MIHRRSWLIALMLALIVSVPVGAQVQQGQPVVPPTTQILTAVSAANAIVTLTMPASGAGLFHYIMAFQVTRTCTTAIVGSAVLTITTTNITNAPAFTMGNACPVGTTNQDVIIRPSFPIKSTTANTATTIVCPAIGATGICRIHAIFYTGF